MIDIVILAAGISSRSITNKAEIKIAGMNLVNYQIEKWLNNNIINSVIVVVNESNKKLINSEYTDKVKLVNGAENRFLSSYAGIKTSHSNYIAIHDMARPYFNFCIDTKFIEKLAFQKALIPYNKVVDSIYNKSSKSYMNREDLILVSTPQFFEKEKILKAYEKFLEFNTEFTDDYSVYSRLYGSNNSDFFSLDESNSKITYGKQILDFYY